MLSNLVTLHIQVQAPKNNKIHIDTVLLFKHAYFSIWWWIWQSTRIWIHI